MPHSLPTFFILGAAKSGTTSLYTYLRQHPGVFMPALKEPRYMAYADDPPSMNGPGDEAANENAIYTLEAYEALFASAPSGIPRGEASPNYLYSETAPARIHELVPDADLLVVLRNPVERAYSHFLHLVRSDREPLHDFEAALDAEDERVEAGWEWSWHYRRMGFYGEQFTRYLNHFDRAQLHVYRFEQLKDNPVSFAQQIFRELGVDASFVPDTKIRHRATGYPRLKRLHQFIGNPDHPLRRWSRYVLPERVRDRILKTVKHANLEKPPMPNAARARLVEVYRDDVRRLGNLLDRDFSDWLERS